MLKLLSPARGASLVELVVALAVGALLVVMAAPNYREWIQNSQIRTLAEGIQGGLQLARAEAVRRNAAVRFQFTDTLTNSCSVSASGNNWVISLADPTGKCATAPSDTVDPYIIQSGYAGEGSANTVVAAGQARITFNGWGRPTSGVSIDISNPTGGTCVAASGKMRCLRVTVSADGQVRLCDPAVSAATDPYVC